MNDWDGSNALFEVPAGKGPSIGREPFGFEHGLGNHPLFDLERLARLAESFEPRDFFVSVPAEDKAEPFYGRTSPKDMTAVQAIEAIEDGTHKLLLKRPEQRDPEYRALLDRALDQIFDVLGEDRRNVIRAESGIFITGFKATTPYHFDPENAFFFQVRGRKTYHVYGPCVVRDHELEAHYARGYVDIGRIEMRADAAEHELVLPLKPGLGLHQPPNAPHWVETHDEISVSCAIGVETIASRRSGQVWRFNHYLRKAGRAPLAPGTRPKLDHSKSRWMARIGPVVPLVARVRNTMRSAVGRG